MPKLDVQYIGRVSGYKLYDVTDKDGIVYRVSLGGPHDLIWCESHESRICSHCAAVTDWRNQSAGATHCNEG